MTVDSFEFRQLEWVLHLAWCGVLGAVVLGPANAGFRCEEMLAWLAGEGRKWLTLQMTGGIKEGTGLVEGALMHQPIPQQLNHKQAAVSRKKETD